MSAESTTNNKLHDFLPFVKVVDHYLRSLLHVTANKSPSFSALVSVPSLSISPLIDVQSEFHPVSISFDQVSKLQTFISSFNTLCLNVARIATVKKVLF